MRVLVICAWLVVCAADVGVLQLNDAWHSDIANPTEEGLRTKLHGFEVVIGAFASDDGVAHHAEDEARQIAQLAENAMRAYSPTNGPRLGEGDQWADRDEERLQELRYEMGVSKADFDAETRKRQMLQKEVLLAAHRHDRRVIPKLTRGTLLIEAAAQRSLNKQGAQDRNTLKVALDTEKSHEERETLVRKLEVEDTKPMLEKLETALSKVAKAAEEELDEDKEELLAATQLSDAVKDARMTDELQKVNIHAVAIAQDAMAAATRSAKDMKELIAQADHVRHAVDRASHWDVTSDHGSPTTHAKQNKETKPTYTDQARLSTTTLGEGFIPGETLHDKARFASNMQSEVQQAVRWELDKDARADNAATQEKVKRQREDFVKDVGGLNEKLSQAATLKSEGVKTLQNAEKKARWVEAVQKRIHKETSDAQSLLEAITANALKAMPSSDEQAELGETTQGAGNKGSANAAEVKGMYALFGQKAPTWALPKKRKKILLTHTQEVHTFDHMVHREDRVEGNEPHEKVVEKRAETEEAKLDVSMQGFRRKHAHFGIGR